jgi:hypothetical protein
MSTTAPELARIRQRLAELEAENHRFRRVAALAAFASLAAVGIGATTSTVPEIVAAKQFVVRDESGRTLAALGVDETGAAGLVVNDDGGTNRIALGLKPEGTAGLALKGEDGGLRGQLVTQPDGRSELSLHDDRGTPRAGIGLTAEGLPRFGLTIPAPPG